MLIPIKGVYLQTVKHSNMAKGNTEIPKGNTEPEFLQRKRIIKNALKALSGKSVACPALDNNQVTISPKSIEETAHHAAKSLQSTLAALDLVNQIRTATFYRYWLPKDNRQIKAFGFEFVIELHGQLSGRTTKLMVGVKITAKYMHYSITSF